MNSIGARRRPPFILFWAVIAPNIARVLRNQILESNFINLRHAKEKSISRIGFRLFWMTIKIGCFCKLKAGAWVIHNFQKACIKYVHDPHSYLRNSWNYLLVPGQPSHQSLPLFHHNLWYPPVFIFDWEGFFYPTACYSLEIWNHLT